MATQRTARRQACSRPALTTDPGTSVRDAARQLLGREVSRLVVVADGKIVGTLSRRDVLGALTRSVHELQERVDAQLAACGVEGIRAEVTAGAGSS